MAAIRSLSTDAGGRTKLGGHVSANGNSVTFGDAVLLTANVTIDEHGEGDVEFATNEYTFTNASDGDVAFLDGGSRVGTVTYTGLEPISNDGDATSIIFNLPDTANPDVALSDAGTPTDGDVQLTGSTFEDVTFSVSAATSITINGGTDADDIDINGLDSAFTRTDALFLNGNAGADTFDIDVIVFPATIDGGADADNLDVSGTAESVTLTVGDTDGYDLTLSGGAAAANIESVTGASTAVLTGLAAQATWTLDGTPAYSSGGNAVTFAGFGTLQGGTDTDQFNVTATSSFDLNGGSGTDAFSINAGLTGAIDGESGTDSLDYSSVSSSVVVDLAAGSATNVSGGVSNIEDVTGGSGSDILTGDSGANVISGGGGSDSIDGGAGDDELNGGAGNDTLTGGPGNDTLSGDGDNDTFTYTGGDGSDVFDGGAGTDTLNILGSTSSAVGDILTVGQSGGLLSVTQSQAALIAYTRTFGGIENLVIDANAGNDNVTLQSLSGLTTPLNSFVTNLGDGDDTLDGSGATAGVNATGGDGNDLLMGSSLNDTLDGGAGNDTLDAGTGNDTINGGTNNDLILWNNGDGDDVIDAGTDPIPTGSTLTISKFGLETATTR